MKKDPSFNLAMLVLRTVLGVIFAAHGAQKLFGMFGGIGLIGTSQMMEGLGFPHPYISAIIWSSAEFFSGIFLIIGFFTRFFASIIVIIMFISIWKINLAYGFFLQNGGYEYNLMIIGSCAPIIILGGGSWSLWDT